MKVWQIAAGEPARDYSSLCIEHDIVMMGPGSAGPYRKHPYPGVTTRRAGQIRSFWRDPKPGDLVLMRLGHQVVAVGVVPEGEDGVCRWREEYDDILGWDLQHTRRVRWDADVLRMLDDIQPVFGTYKQQPTFTRVGVRPILDRAEQLKSAVRDRELRELPESSSTLSDEQLGVELFSAGLGNEAVEDVIRTIRKIRRLASWYDEGQCGKRPNEHEIVAHAVVPLMLGLGWSEQFLGVEWKRVDVAFFDRPPTEEKNCIAICEAKKLGTSLTRAYDQAQRYTSQLGLSNCRIIVTTDGKSLFVYRRQGEKWPQHPTGYANFAKMRKSHIIPKNTSAVETLVGLLPSRIHQD